MTLRTRYEDTVFFAASDTVGYWNAVNLYCKVYRRFYRLEFAKYGKINTRYRVYRKFLQKSILYKLAIWSDLVECSVIVEDGILSWKFPRCIVNVFHEGQGIYVADFDQMYLTYHRILCSNIVDSLKVRRPMKWWTNDWNIHPTNFLPISIKENEYLSEWASSFAFISVYHFFPFESARAN